MTLEVKIDAIEFADAKSAKRMKDFIEQREVLFEAMRSNFQRAQFVIETSHRLLHKGETELLQRLLCVTVQQLDPEAEPVPDDVYSELVEALGKFLSEEERDSCEGHA